MDCNNKKCNWHYDGQCVCESEEAFKTGRPNSMNCDYFLKNTFEQDIRATHIQCLDILLEIQEKLRHRKYSQLKRCRWLLDKLNKEI